MNELLARVIDAHGAMNRWNGYGKVDATIVSRRWIDIREVSIS
jgi:hypothetical protein